MNEYKGWKIKYMEGRFIAEQHGVTINATDENVLKEMIDYKNYRRREERKEK
jgi:hypothetical protein